jgi:hypothetical protein
MRKSHHVEAHDDFLHDEGNLGNVAVVLIKEHLKRKLLYKGKLKEAK